MPKVVCFDFDGVLTSKSAISRFVKIFGHKFEALKYGVEAFEDNKNPEKFFRDVRGLIKLAEGVPYEYVERISLFLKLNKNAKSVMKKLKRDGHKVVIVSINDEGLIKKFLKKCGMDKHIDHIYASKLGTKNGILTGSIYGDVIKTEKVGVIRKIEKLYRTKKEDMIYIGDGLTDLPIMKKIGSGILFCPDTVTNAEVLADRQLMKMRKSGRLFLVTENNLSRILDFIS